MEGEKHRDIGEFHLLEKKTNNTSIHAQLAEEKQNKPKNIG